MILFIEGPRHCGKTFLIKEFLEECKDPRVEYYKFYFANHVKSLNLQGLDSDKALHYFSLGNIMSIMEMNLREEYKDKIWIFDRAILSAYTWAILRNRLDKNRAFNEFMGLTDLDLYSNCKTLMVYTDKPTGDASRTKDIWDGAHTTMDEQFLLQQFANYGSVNLNSKKRGNSIEFVKNEFDENSIQEFKKSCYGLLGL